DVHIERTANSRGMTAEAAEAEDAEGTAAQLVADADLPATFADGVMFFGDVARKANDEAPEQLAGDVATRAAGAANGNAELLGGRHVDARVAHAGGDDQLQVGEAAKETTGERRPLTHQAEDVEGREDLGAA